MQQLYEILLGKPHAGDSAPRGHGNAEPAVAGVNADAEGPDRLFNHYRRQRLAALAQARHDGPCDPAQGSLPGSAQRRPRVMTAGPTDNWSSSGITSETIFRPG